MEIRKILVAVDFSPDSARALDDAIALANTWSAQLHLLHCAPIHPEAVVLYGVGPSESLGNAVRQRAQRRLSEWSQRARAAGVARVEEHVDGRLPSQQIPELARKLGADLIVMGTRGLSGLKHVLLGSVAERTLRAAPCPVWVARHPADD